MTSEGRRFKVLLESMKRILPREGKARFGLLRVPPSAMQAMFDSAKNLMYSKKGVVYKLHAGWFINRTPGEFINLGHFIIFEGLVLVCGTPTERGESLKLNFWPPGSS